MHGLVRDGATVFPQAIGARRDVGHGAHGARRDGDRARDAEPRHSAGAVAGDQHRERRAMGARRRDVRRRSVSHVADGACVRRARSSAPASSRRRSTSSPTSATAGATAIRSTSSERLLEEMYFPPFNAAIREAHARSVMSAYNSVDGSPATQNRALLNGHAQARLGFHRIRHLRRRGDRRRDGAAPHRGEHGDGDEGRARRGARRGLSVVVAAASAVSRRVSARAHRRFGDRRRGRARAAREVRARAVRASVRRSPTAPRTGTAAPSIARSRARRRASRSCCCKNERRRASAREDDRDRSP